MKTSFKVANDIVTIQVVLRKGASALVQWMDNGHVNRVVVPENALLSDTTITKEAIDQGITYGVPWKELISSVTVSGDALENALHDQGIWTYKDFFDKSQEVMGAIHTAFGITYSSLAQLALDHRNNHKEK